jgi:hypothetical protein
MMPVPRRPKRAAGQEVVIPTNGTHTPPPDPTEPAKNGAPKPAPPVSAPLAIVEANGLDKPDVADAEGPRLAPDPGLYAVLGLDPSASDAEIQTNYRRQAARLLNNGSNNTHAMRELNVAYEVLGNPVRREEYDRVRFSQSLTQGPPTPIRSGAKVAARVTRRTRPRHVVQPRYAGLPDVLAVIVVVGLAVLAGTLIIPRLSIDLSPLKALQNVLPLSNSTRRVIDATVTPAPTSAAPTATPRPGVVERFAGTGVSVSNPNPAPNSQQSVVIRLRRDGQPAPNFDVWSIVQYRTTEERWPPAGGVKTDAAGTATITFNVGGATPNYPVQVRVFVQADDQQLTWSTSFTPR